MIVELQPETYDQPDIVKLDVDLADQEITIGSVTKPIGVFIKECPVDLSNYSQEKINEMTIKFIGMSDIAIPEHCQTEFARYEEKFQVKLNYSVLPAPTKSADVTPQNDKAEQSIRDDLVTAVKITPNPDLTWYYNSSAPAEAVVPTSLTPQKNTNETSILATKIDVPVVAIHFDEKVDIDTTQYEPNVVIPEQTVNVSYSGAELPLQVAGSETVLNTETYEITISDVINNNFDTPIAEYMPLISASEAHVEQPTVLELPKPVLDTTSFQFTAEDDQPQDYIDEAGTMVIKPPVEAPLTKSVEIFKDSIDFSSLNTDTSESYELNIEPIAELTVQIADALEQLKPMQKAHIIEITNNIEQTLTELVKLYEADFDNELIGYAVRQKLELLITQLLQELVIDATDKQINALAHAMFLKRQNYQRSLASDRMQQTSVLRQTIHNVLGMIALSLSTKPLTPLAA